MNPTIQKLIDSGAQYGIRVIASIVLFFIGRWLIKKLIKVMDRMMGKRDIGDTLRGFLMTLTQIGLNVFLVIAILNLLGVQTASIIAVVGAAGLAIGLAMQGALSNFASGVLIIIFKPYKIGDIVKVAGKVGKVHAISVFNTILKRPDNTTIIVPNSKATGDLITNYTDEDTRRVDMVFGIGYGDDVNKAREVLLEVVTAHKLVLDTPAPDVFVSELADSSVNFSVRPWVKSEHYLNVLADIPGAVKQGLDAAGISIPFPQQDVHLHQIK